MFANYFYLLRAASEINEKLRNSVITDIYSQQKNVLCLKIPSNSNPERHLILSLNTNAPYLLLKNQYHKAKKNFVNLFSDRLPITIYSIETAVNDRIIRFNTEKGIFLFAIQGTRTNFYYYDNEMNEEKFKKNDYSIKDDLATLSFIEGTQIGISSSLPSFNDIGILTKEFPMIRGLLKKEVIHRSKEISEENIGIVFNKITNEILHNNIKVGFNSDLTKVIFIPDSFLSIDAQSDLNIFTEFNSALTYFIGLQNRKKDLSIISNELTKFFEKELSHLANKINKLKFRVEAGSREIEYYNFGNLLLTNIHLLKKGMREILVNDYSINQQVKINLDPKLFPKDNVNKYFEKAKDEKINYIKSQELLKFNIDKYESLKSEFEKFNTSNSLDEIKLIHNKIIRKKDNIIKMDTGEKFKYWHYKIEGKYDVFIGRDSKSNDYLSIKFAKQNDYWFHARGLPGSHVVLKVNNVKEGIPKNIIKKAASLAAYYSKAKTAGSAPVSYTFAKFVYKKKGMLPGKVMLKKENTLMVKPEIPKQTEIIDQ